MGRGRVRAKIIAQHFRQHAQPCVGCELDIDIFLILVDHGRDFLDPPHDEWRRLPSQNAMGVIIEELTKLQQQ